MIPADQIFKIGTGGRSFILTEASGLGEEGPSPTIPFLLTRLGAVARETRMRRERARFLDCRERRANDESSPFSALGENGRGFDATAPS
jgi:hypothetical protein